MFRFNTVERSKKYTNILEELAIEEKRLDNQYDSVGEIHVLEKYILIMSPVLSRNAVIKKIIKMSKLISTHFSNTRTLERV